LNRLLPAFSAIVITVLRVVGGMFQKDVLSTVRHNSDEVSNCGQQFWGNVRTGLRSSSELAQNDDALVVGRIIGIDLLSPSGATSEGNLRAKLKNSWRPEGRDLPKLRAGYRSCWGIPDRMVQSVERINSEQESQVLLEFEFPAYGIVHIEGSRPVKGISVHISKGSWSLLSERGRIEPISGCLCGWIGIRKNLIRPVVKLGGA